MKDTPAFAGRVTELQFLFQCLGKAAHGEPQVVFLEGVPGVGKSALLQMFGVRAADRQKSTYVFYVRPPEDGAYTPVARAALDSTNKQLYDKVGGRRKAIAAARDLLPEWVSAIPVLGNLMAAIVATAQFIRRRRQRQSFARNISLSDDTEALLAVALRRPLVLLLDELEVAESGAIVELERLVRGAGSGTKLLVVGAYSPKSAGVADAAIEQLIATLPPRVFQRCQLKELDRQELRFWLQKRFPHILIPESFLGWLYERTGGHAASVEALLNRLIDRSVIRFVGRRWEIREDLEEQDSAAHTAAGETLKVDLSAVRPEVVAVLRAASVLGEEFDGSTLAQLLEKDELQVEDQLALAAHHRIVQIVGETSLPDGEIATRYRFRSSHLRSVLCRDLTADARAKLAERREAVASPS
jgi:predicted ATPase